MTLQVLGNSITGSFQNMWGGVVAYIPNIFWALVIFIIGWIVGSLVGKLVAQVIRAAKLDTLLDQAGFGSVMRRAGMTLNSGAFIGGLVEWFVIVAFLVASLQILGLTQVNNYLYSVVLQYLPQVIVAVLILLVSIVIADALSRVVVGSARAMGVRSANLLGSITKWAICIFAFLAALYQLEIDTQLIQTLFTGVVVAFSLSFGLAFGLGGQQAAAHWIEKTRDEISSHKRD